MRIRGSHDTCNLYCIDQKTVCCYNEISPTRVRPTANYFPLLSLLRSQDPDFPTPTAIPIRSNPLPKKQKKQKNKTTAVPSLPTTRSRKQLLAPSQLPLSVYRLSLQLATPETPNRDLHTFILRYYPYLHPSSPPPLPRPQHSSQRYDIYIYVWDR